jgi:DNA-nicking Smr family endonuclease
MSRRRQLSDEERALWTGFVRSITPLRPGRKSAKSSNAASVADDSLKKTSGRHQPVAEPSAQRGFSRVAKSDLEAPSAKSFPLAPLGRRLRQRVARGREPIDARIDLHGLTQLEAHAALLRFLRRARAEGARIALVVTGKGSGNREDSSERGVLKRQVPMWLSLPEFRQIVVGFEDAHAGHGGAGALYVRLRRER